MDIKNEGLKALTTESEQKEYGAIGSYLNLANMKKGDRLNLANGVILERTFDQKNYNENLECTGTIMFVRVVGPETHPNFGSDLSVAGLIEWGII